MSSFPLLRTSIAALPVLAGFALLSLAITGCKSSDSIADPPGVTVTIPKSGSRYSFQNYDVVGDSAKISGATTVTVTATDGSLHGRQNVVIFSPEVGNDDLMLIYEPNGDLSMISTYRNGSTDFQFIMPPKWITLPFGSKQGGLLRSYDTTASAGSISGGLTHRTSAAYLGSEELTFNGEKFTTRKIRVTTNFTATHGSSSETAETNETFWFAPKIGFFLKIEGERSSNRTPAHTGWRLELTSYTLK